MQLASGRAFYPMDPRPSEIHVDDIAHSLSLQCRFAGHCKKHYSVAEHSVRVSRVVPSEHALWGLLHDSAEAFLVDLPRPVKRYSEIGKHYAVAEDRVMIAICERFGLPREMPAEVAHADNVLLVTEQRDLMAPPPMPWRESGVKPLPSKIEPWTPAEAEMRFLMMFRQLTKEAS